MAEPLLPALYPVCTDSSGTLYGLVSEDAMGKDLAGTVAVCDLRSQLVDTQQGQATSMQVAPSGRYLAIAGVDQEDGDQTVVMVVDLHGSHPHESPGRGMHRSWGVGAAAGQSPPVRHKTSTTHLVDYSLFASTPGLELRQMSWHPHSDHHLLLLTSDSRLRMYNVRNVSAPEMTVHLRCTGAGSSASGRYGLSAVATAGEEAVAFAWGGRTGWGPFTLYVLSSVGALYTVCPVATPGMRCSSSSLQQAVSSCWDAWEGEDRSQEQRQLLDWLQCVFGVEELAQLSDEPSWTVLEATESWPVPTLQGPLNLGSESLTPSPHEARALAVLTTHAATGAAPRPRGLSAGPQSGGLHTTTVLATGRRDGHVFLHVLLESVGPCWSHGTGSVRVDSGVSSGTGVRISCDVSSTDLTEGLAVLLDMVALDTSTHTNAPDPDISDSDSYSGPQTPTLPLTLAALSGAGAATVIASHAKGCWAIDLPWLPALSALLADLQREGGGEVVGDLAALPPPIVCELSAAGGGAGDAGELRAACCVQDVLIGRVVLLLQEPGVLACVRPAAVLKSAQGVLSSPAVSAAQGASTSQPRAGTSNSGAPSGMSQGEGSNSAVEATIQSVYADLVTAPPAPAMPSFTGAAANSPVEAAAQLATAVRSLRQGPVESAHRTYTGLVARAAQLDQEAKAQKASVAELEALMSKLETRQKQLSQRAAQALKLHTNLLERAGILTQIHWSAPRPLSDSELQFRADLDVAAARQQALEQTWRHVSARANGALDKSKRAAQEAQSRPSPSPGPAQRKATPGSAGQGSWWQKLGGIPFGSTPSRGTVVAVSGAAGSRVTPAAKLRVPQSQVAPVHDVLKEHMAALGRCASEAQGMQEQMRAWKEKKAAEESAS